MIEAGQGLFVILGMLSGLFFTGLFIILMIELFKEYLKQ